MVAILEKGDMVYIVITGASKGIGLALCEDALARGDNVLAVARNIQDGPLIELEKRYPNLLVVNIDLNEKHSASLIEKSVQHWPCVDVLINNAGIYRGDETVEDFQESFLLNSIRPYFITKELLPMLKKSSAPKSVQISSVMGSIEDNSSGGSYSYRSSKAALNMLFKTLSVDEPWLTVLQFHPGWVKTRMGGEGALISAADSSRGLWNEILTSDLSLSGSFRDYRGENMPW